MAQIIIANKLPQVLEVSILVNGSPESLRLAPNANSQPLDEADLTDHARALAARGVIKIRPA